VRRRSNGHRRADAGATEPGGPDRMKIDCVGNDRRFMAVMAH